MTMTPTLAFEDLEWLHRFATVVARDVDDADDLVQDTLLEAWRKPPPDQTRPLRPWLATVLRNRFRMRRRGDIRRRDREDESTLPAAAEAPAQAQERLEVLQILLGELRTLEPRDQELIVRRFFDDESAAEIGRALGIPAATIRSRVHRSLARLKQGLDRRYGSRQSWRGVVLAFPLTGSAQPVATPTSGSPMSMTAKILLASTAAAASVAGYVAIDPTPDAVPTASASASESRPSSPASSKPAPEPSTPKAKWEQRRAAIQKTAPAELAPKEDARLPDPTHYETTRVAFRELVDTCLEDLESPVTGSLSVAIEEIGAPGVGTIVGSVEVAHDAVADPEVVECLVESMYAFVGEAPEEPYRAEYTRTMRVGRPTDEDAKLRQVVGFIMGAHIGEVRHCGTKAPDAEGTVRFDMEMGNDGTLLRSEAQPSGLPEVVVECVAAATMRWKFPNTLAGEVFEYEFVLPVPGKPPSRSAP